MLTLTVSDQIAPPVADSSVSVDVLSIDDPSSIIAPSNVDVTQDGVFAFSGTSKIRLFDPDPAPLAGLIELDVLNGSLEVTESIAELTITGNGTGSLTIDGAGSRLNLALDSLVYQPDSEFFGNEDLDITATVDGNTTSFTTEIAVNGIPMAEAGGPYEQQEGIEFFLDASASTDDGQSLTFEWDLDWDGGEFDVDVVGAQPAHIIPDDLSATPIALRVTDELGAQDIATSTISASNVSPVAQLLVPQVGFDGIQIELAADVSDPGGENDPLTLLWSVQRDGQTVPLDSQDPPAFTPVGDGNYIVNLIVLDGDGGATHTASTVVVGNAIPEILESEFDPPTASENQLVTLTGSYSDSDETDTHVVVIDWGDGNK